MKPYTHTALNYNKTLTGINVEEFGHSRTTPLKTFGPYWRDTYVLHFVVRGKGIFERKHKPKKVGAGECFIIVPNERTSYTPDEFDPWEYYWICFKGTDAADLLRMCGIDCSKPTMPYEYDDVEPLFRFIEQYEHDYYKLTVPDILRSVGVLMETLANIGSRNVAQPDQPKPYRNKIVHTALSYMETNYYKGINITELSKELYISRSYFTTVFTEEMGISPSKYLLKLRVNKAKDLMSERPDLSIAEIGRAVGFEDITRFCKVYSRYEMQTPNEHKKELIGYLSSKNGKR